MTYADAVRALYALGNEVRTARLGLERIRAALARLGDPQKACRFVHVAGTNGKGSVCAMIEAGLRTAGVRTGLYTSPHLVEPTERIRIDGEQISRDEFVRTFQTVRAASDELTYFETVTAMAFLAFREHAVELVALEVGLGGRLDATNVVMPELCVITAIDLDHQNFLGDTLQQIAAEKAGILKAGVPAVFSRQKPEAEGVLEERAGELGIPVSRTSDFGPFDVRIEPTGSRFFVGQPPGLRRSLRPPAGRLTSADEAGLSSPSRPDRPPHNDEIVCPLAGEHQVENALTAAVALSEMGYPPDGIRHAQWPGRLERLANAPEIVLDGAHNIGGAEALAAWIRRFYTGRRIWIVFGAMSDKNAAASAALLFPLAARVIATAADNVRALAPAEIAAAVPAAVNVSLTSSVPEALALVRAQASKDDAVFITGSLYVVGEARRLLVPADYPLAPE